MRQPESSHLLLDWCAGEEAHWRNLNSFFEEGGKVSERLVRMGHLERSIERTNLSRQPSRNSWADWP